MLQYLEKKIDNSNDRTDMEQLLLLLYSDIMITHSTYSLEHYVEQLTKKDEINILIIHVDENISIHESAMLHKDFVKKVYSLLVFSLGPDYEGNFQLLDKDEHQLESGESYYDIEKQFFSELCTAELISSVKMLTERPSFISVFTLMIE